MVAFGVPLGLTPVSVRRAVAALRFAEQLVQAGVVPAVDDLASVRLEALDKLKRMHGYGRAGLEAVRDLLPRVRDGSLNGADLKDAEMQFRREEGARARRSGENSLELRLRTPAFRVAGLAALRARAADQGARLHVFAAGSKALAPLSLDAMAIHADGLTRASKLLPAAAGSRESRLSEAVVLALAGARIFDEFEIVAQDSRDGSFLTAKASELGPDAGVAVSWISSGPRAELVEKVVPGPRKALPDLRGRFASRLAAMFTRLPAPGDEGPDRPSLG